MNIEFAHIDVLPNRGTLVLFSSADGQLGSVADDLDQKSDGALKRAIGLAGDKFKRSAVDLVCPAGLDYDRVILFAVDDPADCQMFDLESIGGRIAVKLGSLSVKTAHIVVDDIPGIAKDGANVAIAFATGIRLRDYRFDKYRTSSEDDAETPAKGLADVTFHLGQHDNAASAWLAGAAIAAGVEHGRDLVTEPANVLTPAAFATHCKKLGKDLGLEVDVLGQSGLEKLGMRALLGVSQGSANEPYVVVMNWKGGKEGDAPIALIGKGVCFDTGGISLKPSGGMEEMKWDMGGAAAVFGAMKAIAGRKAKANVVR